MTETRYSSLKFALETFFNAKRLTNGQLQISHGAQFSRKGGVFGWFILLLLLIVGIVFMTQGSQLEGILFIVSALLILVYIIDIQGISFDFSAGKARSYRAFMGLHLGTWYTLAEPWHLKILEDTILEGRALSSGNSYQSGRSYDSHHFYTLYLVLETNKTYLKLYEDESITKVRHFAQKFSDASQIPYNAMILKGNIDLVHGI
jgi:hypothetical protein